MSELTEEQTKNALGGCAVLFISLLATPLTAFWTGFVMLQLYNWFILPIQGAPAVGIGNMLGAALLVQLTTFFLLRVESKKEIQPWGTVAWELFARICLVPAVFLGFGWLYQMWFMR